MKKSTKTKAIALAFITGSLLTGCGSSPDDFQTVYGPPTTEITSETDTEETTSEDISTPSEYNPEDDEMQTVYGPPTDK